MKKIKLTSETTTIKIGDVTITAYLLNGKTIINICTKETMAIEPISTRYISIKQ